jgi:guanylate kinase
MVRSCTTRERREGESEREYDFISREQFIERKKDFFEIQEVYDGNFYGTLREDLCRDNIILVVHPSATSLFKKEFPELITIFLIAPSAEQLLKRAEGRKQTRWQFIQEELNLAKTFDYVLENNDLETTLSLVSNIVELEKQKEIALITCSKVSQYFSNTIEQKSPNPASIISN